MFEDRNESLPEREPPFYKAVGGTFATWDEYKEFLPHRRSFDFLTLLLLTALAAFFSYETLGTLFSVRQYGNDGELTTVIGSIFIALASIGLTAWLIVCAFDHRRQRNRAVRREYAERFADRKRIENGRLIELFEDRITCTDLRGQTVIPFANVTAYTERKSGIEVRFGEKAIFLRSKDLSVYDLPVIRAHIRCRLPQKAAVSVKDAALTSRTEPLSLPRFSYTDPVLARAAVTLPVVRERKAARDRMQNRFVIPFLLLYALTMTAEVSLTPFLFLDALLWALIFLGAGLFLFRLSAGRIRNEKSKIMQAAFTVDGMALQTEEKTAFLVWNGKSLKKQQSGILILRPDGRKLLLPWSVFDDLSALKRIGICE